MVYTQALRAFVTDALGDVDGATLTHLCDTFHLDPTAFPTKADVLRSIVDLVLKDRDTALGLFVAWKQALAGGGSTPVEATVLGNAGFSNAFLPVDTTSPRKVTGAPPGQKRIFDFVLDRDMAVLGDELTRLEAAYKDAERGLHQGRIDYDKIKRFLQTLTQLRAKDDQFRILLLEKNQNLRADNARLFRLEAHTRHQLEFFVDGCARLRCKHDAMVEDFSRVSAADAAAHEVMVQLYGGECAFSQALTTTLHFKCQRLTDTEATLSRATAAIASLEAKVEHQRLALDAMRAKWDAAAKDALCAKVQLRRCRKRMHDADSLASDAMYLRERAMAFQHMVCDLMGMGHVHTAAFQDAKGAFVKSADKTSIAWRALRYLTAVSSPKLDRPSSLTSPSSLGSSSSSSSSEGPFPAIQMPAKRRRDVLFDLSVVIVVGGGALVSSVVHRLCLQFGYSSLDVEAWRVDSTALSAPEGGPEEETSAASGTKSISHDRLAWAIQATGSVLVFNWPGLQPGDVNRLIQHGANVKMVLDLGGSDASASTLLAQSCGFYRKLPTDPPLHVDQIVHDTALVWQAHQDHLYSLVGIGWDPATAVLNERCAMMGEELTQRMAVEWGKHLAVLAEKKAAADAKTKAKLQANSKTTSVKRPPSSNNRSTTPSQKTKPGTPARAAAATGRATPSKGKPQASASPSKPPSAKTPAKSPVKTPAKKK